MQSAESAPGGTLVRRTSTTTYRGRAALLPLALGVVVVPAALAGLAILGSSGGSPAAAAQITATIATTPLPPPPTIPPVSRVPSPPPFDSAALRNAITALGPISFEPGTAELTSSGGAAVDQLGTLLRTAPVTVEITGHAAATPGRVPTAQELSEQRARAVSERLGSGPEKIVIRGAADGEPVAPNDTAEGRAANRRVEITVR